MTPATSASPSQKKVLCQIVVRVSIAAAAVISLKIDPGTNAADISRLIYTPSSTLGSGSVGSMAGDDTMHSSSPVR